MEDPIGAEVVTVGTTNDANERQILTISTGNGVDGAKATDAESDDASSDAARSSIAIGGVAGVELVATADDVEPRLGNEIVEEREVEVAGNGEDVGDANLHEAASQVAAERGLAGGDHRRRSIVLDGRNGAVWQATDVVARWLTRVQSTNLGVHGYVKALWDNENEILEMSV